VKSSKSQLSGALLELCGALLDRSGTPDLVLRVATELAKSGDERGADAIRGLVPTTSSGAIATPDKALAVVPNFSGETLTRSARVPVDRETSAPLATVLLPKALPATSPILSPALTSAVQSWIAEWGRAAELRTVGIEPAHTCVLFGDPGTGKTDLALWIAGQLGLPVILARLDGLMSSFLGTTSRNIGNLFAFANRHRAILVLDEFDAIAKLRDDPNEVGEIKRVVNTLLQNLDERADKGLTIGITNHPQLLDPAVWRRFELQIQLPKPDLQTRASIAERYAQPLRFTRGQLKLVASILEGASGAEILDVVRSLKKSWILEGSNVCFANRLQNVISTHAARVPAHVVATVNAPMRDFACMLHERYAFTLIELSEVFGVNRTTISRWVS